MPTQNDKRIARNTIYLYGRMLLTIFISLYTWRVVLDVLGVHNYGIYSLVGGIVMVFGFVNGSMAGASSRFLAYELGAGSALRLRQTFSSSMTVHAAIALILLVLAETLGLWYVNNELVIAPHRMCAANWTYQFAVGGMLVLILQVPYMGLIIAHERMGYYAVVAVINVLMKLGIAMLLMFRATADNLIVFSGLMFVAALAVGFMYAVYCRIHFAEARWSLGNPPEIIKALLKFCGWNVYSQFCLTLRLQGLPVMLNRIGGTVLNAAAGLTTTISTTVTSFATSVITAFRPQIVQQYARGDYSYMSRLLVNCARFSLLLVGLIIVPVIIDMEYLLGLWLVEVPHYTTVFARLALMAVCGELLNEVLTIGVHATGRITGLSVITGTMYLVELLAMWVMLRLTDNPPVVYAVHVVFMFAIVASDTLILKQKVRAFGARRFWFRGVMTPLAILVASGVLTWIPLHATAGFMQLVMTVVSSALWTALLGWIFAIDGETRRMILAHVRNKLLSR